MKMTSEEETPFSSDEIKCQECGHKQTISLAACEECGHQIWKTTVTDPTPRTRRTDRY